MEARLLTYLGGDGPRWQPHWVEVDNRTVLVVEVAAPRAGDIMFHLHKKGPGVEDGSIFIRRGAATVPPSSSELHGLFGRAAAAPVLTGVRLVLAEPDHLPPIDFSDEAIERWLGRTRQECMSSLRAYEKALRQEVTGPRHLGDLTPSSRGQGLSVAELEDLEARVQAGGKLSIEEAVKLSTARESVRKASAMIAASFAGMYDTEPDQRTPEQYTAEVDAFIDACRELMPSILRKSAGEHLDPAQFVLCNDTDENYPEVEVRVHIDGSVEAVPHAKRASNEGRLPNRPRPYGPVRRRLGAATFGHLTDFLNSPIHHGNWIVPPVAAGSKGPSVQIENSGSVTLTFTPVDLRPRQQNVPLPTAVLLAHIPSGATVRATWEATSSGVRGIARGELHVPITGEPWSVAEALAEDERTGAN